MSTDIHALMQMQTEIEKEIEEITTFLTQPGYPGLSGGLVDAEGYPIDAGVHHIIAVRTARGRLSCLQNDHISLMKSLESALYSHHNVLLSEKSRQSPPTSDLVPHTTTIVSCVENSDTVGESSSGEKKEYALFRVIHVDSHSAADISGFQANDTFLSFGSLAGRVDGWNRRQVERGIDSVLRLVRSGQAVNARIRRNSQVLALPICAQSPSVHSHFGWRIVIEGEAE